MANQVGKRYVCSKCDSEFIVTREGEGTLVCCGKPLETKGTESEERIYLILWARMASPAAKGAGLPYIVSSLVREDINGLDN